MQSKTSKLDQIPTDKLRQALKSCLPSYLIDNICLNNPRYHQLQPNPQWICRLPLYTETIYDKTHHK